MEVAGPFVLEGTLPAFFQQLYSDSQSIYKIMCESKIRAHKSCTYVYRPTFNDGVGSMKNDACQRLYYN